MIRRWHLILLAAVSLLWAGVPALWANATVTLIPAQHDVRIINAAPDTNYIDQEVVSVYNDGGGNVQRSLLQFNLDHIPNNQTIVSATLTIWRDSEIWLGGDNFQPTNVFVVTQPWVDSEVTWNSSHNGQGWFNPGGDFFGPVATNALNIPNGTVGIFPLYFDVSTLVADWHKGVFPNYGLLIAAPPGNELHCHADRGENIFLFPTLTIIYSPGH
jgi:hypothetical protein